MDNMIASYRLDDLKQRTYCGIPIGIMLVGSTGAGKSSTINALLGTEAAKVGYGVDPETMHTKCYKLNDYIHIYDTPGLGDSPEQDKKHMEEITSLLYMPSLEHSLWFNEEMTWASLNQYLRFCIDLVIVIIDGSKRDMGTIFPFVKDVIMPKIPHSNIIVMVNQADMAMKGRHFDEITGKPDAILEQFLEDQAVSIQQRITESLGIPIAKPVMYSAVHNFNIYAIIDHIIDNTEWKFRATVIDTIVNAILSPFAAFINEFSRL